MSDRLIFCYGTLRRGWWNHGLLADTDEVRFIGEGKTYRRYSMVADSIPFVIKHAPAQKAGLPLFQVAGEVYRVSQKTLARLDRLEGHPRWYQRENIPVRLENGALVSAWLYFAPGSYAQKNCAVVPDGDFKNTVRNEREWQEIFNGSPHS